MNRQARVGEILKLERRRIEVDPLKTYVEIGVRSFGKGIFHKEPVTGADIGSKRVFEIHPGDLIFSNVFAWEGAVGLAGDCERGRLGSHRFMTYVALSDDVDLGYLRYFFVSEPGLALLNRASPGSAGRNKTLAIDRFEALEVALPDIGEQRRIAARLDRLSASMARLADISDRSSRVQAGIGPALAQRHDLTEEIKRHGGWKRVPLGEAMLRSNRIQPVRSDETYPNLGVFSFGRGLFEKPPIDGWATSARTLNRICSGQFIYSRLFAFEGAYAEVTPRFDGYFVSNEFPTFDVDPDRALAGFIVAYLSSPSIWSDLAASSKGLGVRRQRVQPDKLLNFSIWLPPLHTQRRVVKTIGKLNECRAGRQFAGDALQALEKAILNRAFAGLP